jgi:transmembrane sensor
MRTTSEIRREAAQWYTWVDSDEVNEERQRKFEAWLAADARHRAAFLRMHRTWERIPLLRQFPEAALLGSSSSHWLWHNRRFVLGGVAALVLAVLAIGLLPRTPDTQWSSYSTTVGQISPLTLRDGTRATLNTNSEIRVHIDQYERRIQLVRGEVLLDVAHDSRRPFVVLARQLRVRDAGTRFSVRSYEQDRVGVIVSEGRVDLTPVWSIHSPFPWLTTAALSTGDRAWVFAHKTSVVRLDLAAITRRLSWPRGVLSYAGEPLSEVIEDLNRYNSWQFEIDDPTISGVRIGGDFPATDPRVFVRALTSSFDIEATFSHSREGNAGVIHLRRRNAER